MRETKGNWRKLKDHHFPLQRLGNEWAALGISDEIIYTACMILKRDDFVDYDKLTKALVIMKDMQLSPKLMNEVNKSIWIDLIDMFEQLVGYSVKGSSVGHWSLIFKTSSGVNVQAELIGEAGLDHLEYTINARNGYFTKDTVYIYPRLLVNVESKALLTDCRVPWNRFLVAMAMDEQCYKVFDQFLNNCQQWCERICQHLQLDGRTPVISEKTAKSVRGSSWCTVI